MRVWGVNRNEGECRFIMAQRASRVVLQPVNVHLYTKWLKNHVYLPLCVNERRVR